jgi:UDP-N-acetylglucosamine--N-acetylmuramyl-(pentapeptide) pyrophosphoryl-undecaprenol N-acetylglucosamine transferase
VVSRAGAGGIFEIASWGLPSVIIPLKGSAQDHQTKNAFSYARAGACVVIEENNLTPRLLLSEINRILSDQQLANRMKEAARAFGRPDASKTIANALLDIALSHEA